MGERRHQSGDWRGAVGQVAAVVALCGLLVVVVQWRGETLDGTNVLEQRGALLRELDADSKILGQWEKHGDESLAAVKHHKMWQKANTKQKMMMSKYGVVPASWCGPDSPRCVDLKGKHNMGEAGEPTSHGLLNLASKYPDLYAKAMRRNGGNFNEVVKEEEKTKSAATPSKPASDKELDLDSLKERYPELYKEAMHRNGGSITKAEEEEKQEDSKRTSSLAQVEYPSQLYPRAHIHTPAKPRVQSGAMAALRARVQKAEAEAKLAKREQQHAQSKLTAAKVQGSKVLAEAAETKERVKMQAAERRAAMAEEEEKRAKEAAEESSEEEVLKEKAEKLEKKRQTLVASAEKMRAEAKATEERSKENIAKMPTKQVLADLLADETYHASAAKAAKDVQRMQHEIASFERRAAIAKKEAAAIHVAPAAKAPAAKKAAAAPASHVTAAGHVPPAHVTAAEEAHAKAVRERAEAEAVEGRERGRLSAAREAAAAAERALLEKREAAHREEVRARQERAQARDREVRARKAKEARERRARLLAFESRVAHNRKAAQAHVTKKPEAHVTKKPEAHVTKKPEAHVTKPVAAVTKTPEAHVPKEPEAKEAKAAHVTKLAAHVTQPVTQQQEAVAAQGLQWPQDAPSQPSALAKVELAVEQRLVKDLKKSLSPIAQGSASLSAMSEQAQKAQAQAYRNAYKDAFHDAFTAVFAHKRAPSVAKAISAATQPSVTPSLPYPQRHAAAPATPQDRAIQALQEHRHEEDEESHHEEEEEEAGEGHGEQEEEGGGEGDLEENTGEGQKHNPNMLYRSWDHFVPADKVEATDRRVSGRSFSDHFADWEPKSDRNLKLLYGTHWKYTNPDAHYKYGKPTPDHPDYFTSVDYGDTQSGERPLDWKGGDEDHFYVVNRGKVGDHLVGGNDKMVPDDKSENERRHGLYVGSVSTNMRMARQHEEDGLIGDRVWGLPKGYKNQRIMYGGIEDYAGDKHLGFGDQLVPIPEAVKQQWGAGGWKGKHTHHLADFLVGVNPSGNPKAFGTEPFKVRHEPYGDGKTDD